MTRSHRIASFLVAGLGVAALVLGVLVWQAAGDDVERRIAIGGSEALRSPVYGHEVVVRVPGAEVTALVGAPTEHLDSPIFENSSGLYDPDAPVVVTAEDDGLLVPVATRASLTGGFASVYEDDATPIVVRLVAGGRTIDLTTFDLGDSSARSEAFTDRGTAVAVDGGLALDDLAVEVEFDGVTQTADVATGEVDAGAARALYDADVVYATGCADVPSPCEMQAPDGSRWRAADNSYTVSGVSVYPYDGEHGWADEGYRWASARVQLFGVYDVVDAEGTRREVTEAAPPVITLDGAAPAHADDLTGADGEAYGRVVFRIAEGAVPQELDLAQQVTLVGARSPRTLTLSDRVALTPPG